MKKKKFLALWGKLAAEILMVNTEAAYHDLCLLRDAIDSRVNVSHLHQLQQRTWLIHWALWPFLRFPDFPQGRNFMIDFLLEDNKKPEKQKLHTEKKIIEHDPNKLSPYPPLSHSCRYY